MKKLISIILVIAALVAGYFLLFKKESKSKGLYVVNVLDKDLFSDCHIKGSINIPFEEVEQFANKIDKSSHVVFYCSNYMCTASGISARLFKKLGFENVWAYEAGMADWYQNKLPVEGVCKQNYLEMKVDRPQFEETDIKIITTDELKNKMKEMLHIQSI